MIQVRFLFVICLVLKLFPVNADQVQLIYLPNTPVKLQSTLEMNFDQTDPGLMGDSSVVQELEATLSLNDPANMPFGDGPFNMVFQLTNLRAASKLNGITTNFQAAKPETSLILAEIKDFLNRPISIHFDSSLRIRPEATGLDQLFKELPVLNNINSLSLLKELFEHMFALSGRKLSEGECCVIVGESDSPDTPPRMVTYQIESIDKDSIRARLSEGVNHPPITLKTPLEANGKNKDPATFKFKKKTEGEIVWQRKNALIHEVRTKTIYEGSINAGTSTWPVNIEIRHFLKSEAVPKTPPPPTVLSVCQKSNFK